jgi:hypothetical protein
VKLVTTVNWLVAPSSAAFGCRVVSRTKSIVLGLKVQPAEIDSLLETYPGIAEVCVFAVPDPISGESVGAAIRFTTARTRALIACDRGAASVCADEQYRIVFYRRSLPP